MRRENLRSFFDASPTARLLRSDHAPFIIEFLHRTFKTDESISLGLSELRTRLWSYQEELHETAPEILIGSADRYLIQWSDAGWLQRFLESQSNEPQFQLTRHAEEAIRFVDVALSRATGLVGTESRLRMVIDTLDDLVRGATADPDRRLAYLRAQRDAINQEIEEIESGKSVQVYRPSQIRERFQNAVDLLKALQSDFRAVEERFQEIARDVQHLQASGEETRGGILGYALDAEDHLKQQDEGLSFFAFVAFLFSPSQQASLRKNIEELQSLAALADQHESMTRVRRMVPSLLAEAEKVMRTTARLSATLRRLLDARAAAHRVRLANVLREIRDAALKLREHAPVSEVTFSLLTELEIQSPLARTFWSPPQSFQMVQPIAREVDAEHAQQLAQAFARMHRLDFRRLRGRIRESTSEGRTATLGEVLAIGSSQGGMVELLGFLQIAHDDGHRIDTSLTETIHLPPGPGREYPLSVTVPHVTFLPKAATHEFSRKPR